MLLRSNASPLQRANRVLQNTSGNSGFIYESDSEHQDFATGPVQKQYSTEYNHSALLTRRPPVHRYHCHRPYGLRIPRRHHESPSFYADGSHLFPLTMPDAHGVQREVVLRIDEALREEDQSRYRDYRQRSRQDIGKDGLPVWPEELENAFQRG